MWSPHTCLIHLVTVVRSCIWQVSLIRQSKHRESNAWAATSTLPYARVTAVVAQCGRAWRAKRAVRLRSLESKIQSTYVPKPDFYITHELDPSGVPNGS